MHLPYHEANLFTKRVMRRRTEVVLGTAFLFSQGKLPHLEYYRARFRKERTKHEEWSRMEEPEKAPKFFFLYMKREVKRSNDIFDSITLKSIFKEEGPAWYEPYQGNTCLYHNKKCLVTAGPGNNSLAMINPKRRAGPPSLASLTTKIFQIEPVDKRTVMTRSYYMVSLFGTEKRAPSLKESVMFEEKLMDMSGPGRSVLAEGNILYRIRGNMKHEKTKIKDTSKETISQIVKLSKNTLVCRGENTIYALDHRAKEKTELLSTEDTMEQVAVIEKNKELMWVKDREYISLWDLRHTAHPYFQTRGLFGDCSGMFVQDIEKQAVLLYFNRGGEIVGLPYRKNEEDAAFGEQFMVPSIYNTRFSPALIDQNSALVGVHAKKEKEGMVLYQYGETGDFVAMKLKPIDKTEKDRKLDIELALHRRTESRLETRKKILTREKVICEEEGCPSPQYPEEIKLGIHQIDLTSFGEKKKNTPANTTPLVVKPRKDIEEICKVWMSPRFELPKAKEEEQVEAVLCKLASLEEGPGENPEDEPGENPEDEPEENPEDEELLAGFR
ncbi:MAG: uncharacterized protein A8A55_0339 [Amphiamblys sp. WSBS2006]|nr:MAG: uncharacterized protein A8A55_0339 [Amphiamblys sp. WSBS2006]